ncbi:MAG: CBS domain-containing protein [Leptospiraceae bacterium]|nr:CBS domain-containing protein [Leptospiraceae bacterium]
MRYTDKLTVGELMLKDVITAKESDNVQQVYVRMLEGRFRHMPVVKAGRLVGIVSDRDLRNALVIFHDGEGKKEIVGNRQLNVAKIMTREPLVADSGDSVKTAVRLMVKHKVGCLPVCDDDGRLLGLITETDMLRLLEELLTVKKK